MLLNKALDGVKDLMRKEFARFEELLIAATAEIADDYFQLPVAGADAVYRERVYCYELYHQLRCLWKDFPFRIGGEVDKRGHPHFEGGPYALAKPDLLVHVPKNMGRNLVVVEVKPCSFSKDQAKEDLKKLAWFCRKADYYGGVFLVYGALGDSHETLARRVAEAASDEEINMDQIHVFHHAASRRPAARIV
jgi:hypothetical protein